MKILLADDHTLFRDGLRRVLARLGGCPVRPAVTVVGGVLTPS